MQNNGAKPYDRRPDESVRNADVIKNAAMCLVQDLHAAGRADLTPPFLDVLKALANVDYEALAEVDAAMASKGGVQ